MLDVHPPHAPTHTWKDFFIHIATIVVGLLIAVGLEQTVEWLHHKSEVRETRQLLKEERTQNIERFHQDVTFVRNERAELENNLRIFSYLQKHPGTPLDKLPGVPVWGVLFAGSSQASWLSAKQSNVFTFMPQAEVEESRSLYEELTQNAAKEEAVWQAFNKANAYTFLQPDPTKLTPAQVEAEIPLIQDCLRLVFLRDVQLENISRAFADFAPGPSGAELSAFKRELFQNPAKDFPAAWAFTKHDIDSASALDAADKPFILFAKETSEQGAAHATQIYDELHAKYPTFKPEEDTLNIEGYGLMAKGDLTGAINLLKLNVQLYPNSWNVYDSLGEAYAKAGNKPLAIENYQHALKLNPTAQSSIDALKNLHQ